MRRLLKGLVALLVLPTLAVAGVALGLTAWRLVRAARPPERTCLVLSVGGARALAQLGAIDALRAKGLRFDCVYGNSMGAVVGVLYAADPRRSVVAAYQELAAGYAQATRSDVQDDVLERLVATFVLDTPEPMLALALTGSEAARPTNRRLEQLLRRHLGGRRIESLAVPFATSHYDTARKMLLVTAEGDAAAAVAAGAANPEIFDDIDVDAPAIDPGIDRVAAVPIADACRRFPGARLVVLNATGAPAFPAPAPACSVTEIRVDAPSDPAALLGQGPAFRSLVAAGARAVARDM